jgi:hypothetical protein
VGGGSIKADFICIILFIQEEGLLPTEPIIGYIVNQNMPFFLLALGDNSVLYFTVLMLHGGFHTCHPPTTLF